MPRASRKNINFKVCKHSGISYFTLQGKAGRPMDSLSLRNITRKSLGTHTLFLWENEVNPQAKVTKETFLGNMSLPISRCLDKTQHIPQLFHTIQNDLNSNSFMNRQ